MRKEIISPWQLTCFTLGFTLGSSMIFATGIRFGGRATWAAELLSSVFGVVIIMMMAYIVNKFPGKSLLQIMVTLTGPFWGRLFLLFYILFAGILTSLVIYTIQDLFTTAILPETPGWVFCLTMSLTAGYILRQGLEATARTSEVIIPIIVPVLGLMLFAAVFMVKKAFLLPVLAVSPLNFIRALVVLTAFPIGEIFLLAPLALNLKDPQKALKAILSGFLVASFFLIVRPIFSIGIFSVNLAKNLVFPAYMIARVIRIGEFVERIESFLLFAWFFVIFIKVAVCAYAALQGTSELFKLSSYQSLVYPFCIMIIPLSIIGYESHLEVSEFLSLVLPILTLPACFFLLPLLVLLTIRRKPGLNRPKRPG